MSPVPIPTSKAFDSKRHERFSRKPKKFFGELPFYFLVGGPFNRGFIRVRRPQDVAAIGLVLYVERELRSLSFRKIKSWHRRAQCGQSILLNFLIQFLTRRRFEWGNGRIATASDKATFGFGLYAIRNLR